MKKTILIGIAILSISIHLGYGQLQKQLKKAIEYYENGEYKEAVNLYEAILPTAIAKYGENDTLIIAPAYYFLAASYDASAKSSEANIYLAKAIKIYRFHQNSKSLYLAYCYQLAGKLMYDKGNYMKSRTFYKSSAKILDQYPQDKAIVTVTTAIGTVNYNLGNYKKAEEYYNKSLGLTSHFYGEHSMEYANLLNNFGVYYLSLGNNPKAEKYFQLSANIKKNIAGEDNLNYANSINNLAIIFQKQKKFLEAKDLYNKRFNILQKLNKEVITTNSNLSLYYSSQQAYTLLNLGILYREEGRMDWAEKKAKTAIDIFVKATFNLEHPDYAKFLTELGNIYYLQNKLEPALKSYLKANKINEKTNTGSINYSEGLLKIAQVYDKLNQLDSATSFYVRGLKSLNKNILPVYTFLSEYEKEMLFENLEAYFNSFANFVVRNHAGYPELKEILYDNLIFKKNILLRSTNTLKNAIDESNDSTTINLYEQFIEIQKQIVNHNSAANADAENILEQLEETANQIEKQLIKKSFDFASFMQQNKITWMDVKKNLLPNTAVVEYFNASNEHDTLLNALILKYDCQSPELITLFKQSDINKLVGSFGWSDPTLVKMIYQKGSRKGLRLYEKIWQPLESYLNDVKTIYIAPSGVLHQIAFNAIPCPDSTLLCDKYNINMVSSTRILADSAMQEPMFASGNNTVAVFGGIQYDEDTTLIASLSQYHKTNSQQLAMRFKESNATRSSVMPWQYLYGTMQEANSINQMLQKKKINTTLYSGSNALEEYFKQLEQQPSPDIIHIATHGFSFPLPDKQNAYKIFENSFVQNFNPLFRTGLLFAGANRTWANASRIDSIEDGVLTAYEVSNMNLQNTQLVVLSACETGLGDIKGSEGVYGLQRAFKMAGVKYIIMSLWPVPDNETQELMVTFYDKLIATKNIRKAFISAQNEMKKKYEPYYWAGFVLIE